MVFRPNSRHPDYKRWTPKFIRQRHVTEGEDAVKEQGTTYLPKLAGQDGPSGTRDPQAKVQVLPYDSYKTRATFINATARTQEALSGAILRKDPQVKWPENDIDFLETAGRCLESFSELIDIAASEVIGIGRYGHLVDASFDGVPFVCEYFAENITDWELGSINGRKVPVRVHLREENEVEIDGHIRTRERYRILWLGAPAPMMTEDGEILDDFGLTEVDFQGGPIYYQEIWDEIETTESAKSGQKEFVKTSTVVPRPEGGGVFNEIPFTFFNGLTTRPKPEKPPLLDVAIINLSLYRNSADLEHGLHFTGLPQAWAAGFDFSGPVSIGSTTVWVTENSQASAGYLEFSGNGLAAIRETMRDKKKEMAALAAKILEESPTAGGNEAAETLKLRHSGENSILARISKSLSNGLSQTLKYLAMFKRIDPSKVGVTLSRDFGTVGLSPQMLTALLQGVQLGRISPQTLHHNMAKGELLEDNLTYEEEEARILAAGIGTEDEIDPDPDPDPEGDE